MKRLLFRMLPVVAIFCATFFATSARALNLGDIVTKVGGGVGDGGAAPLAGLNNPTGLTMDGSGNLYIADYYNYRIRKIDAVTGIITTVAGNGTYGFSGDGELATSASLNCPRGVAVDSSGNLYIADSGNNRIRKVEASTGIITTVVGNGTAAYAGDGGQATAASIRYPLGIAVDYSGNLYIADTNNFRVRKIAVGTGIITTIAGNGSFSFSGDGGPATSAGLSPVAVTLDSGGNLYIAENINNRIRKVVATTGIITTVAGNGTAAFTGDGGPATSACLSSPSGVMVDRSGTLWIADTNNHRIRAVTGTGVITTAVGNGVATFAGDGGSAISASLNGPWGVISDSTGNLYIADTNNNRIRKRVSGSWTINTIAGNGGSGAFSGDNGPATISSLNRPYGMSQDSSGNLYFADHWNHRIRKWAIGNGIITTVAGNGTATFGGDGGQANAASLYYPFDVTVDSSGNLYIADEFNDRIRKVAAGTGIITTVAGNGTRIFGGDGEIAISASLWAPTGVAVDSFGNLYIADYGHNRIRKVSADTGIISTVAGNGTATFGGDGGSALSASLYAPIGVAVDNAGNLYIADSSNHRIRKVAADTGIITTVAGNGTASFGGDGGAATLAKLYYPNKVAVDSTGNLYIADTNNSRIRRVDASSGIINTVAGSGFSDYSGDGGAALLANLKYPRGVLVDNVGNLFIADTSNNRIRKVYFVTVPTATAIASSAPGNTSTAGDTITFTATATSGDGIPEGMVTFMDGSDTLGTSTLDPSGSATLNISTLANGSHSITATYGVNGIYDASTSSTLVQTVNAATPSCYTLTVSFSGTGNGMIIATPVPPGIQCSTSCSQSFSAGTSVTLTPTVANDSYFAGWSGCDQVAIDVCTVSMNTARVINVEFEFNWPILIGVLYAGYNGTLQGAYDTLSTGSNVLRLKTIDFTGDLNCNKDVQLTLQGGCNKDVSDCSGMSNLNGNLIISVGSVSIANITLK